MNFSESYTPLPSKAKVNRLESCVVIPIHTTHYLMLQRNLIYTAITRGKKLVVLVGSKRAVGIAVGRMEAGGRVTRLGERLVAAGCNR